MVMWLSGLHSVKEAIHNPRRVIESIYCLDSKKSTVEGYLDSSGRKNTPRLKQLIQVVNPKQLDALFEYTSHQGIALKVQPLPSFQLTDYLDNLTEANEHKPILMLDSVKDVQNIGSIFRLCAAFEVGLVVIPKHNSVIETPASLKIASGGFDITPFSVVTNLNQALITLKQDYFFNIYGLSGNSAVPFHQLQLNHKRVVYVLGSESEGLHLQVEKKCDQVLRIATNPSFPHLNVTHACSIILSNHYQKAFP